MSLNLFPSIINETIIVSAWKMGRQNLHQCSKHTFKHAFLMDSSTELSSRCLYCIFFLSRGEGNRECR